MKLAATLFAYLLVLPAADPLQVAGELEASGRYEEASTLLADAFGERQDPLFLLGRAEIERRGLSCRVAIELYRQYLRAPSGDVQFETGARKMVNRCDDAVAMEEAADVALAAGRPTDAARQYSRAFEINGSRELHRKRVRVEVALKHCASAGAVFEALEQRLPKDEALEELRTTLDACTPSAAAALPAPTPEQPPALAPKPASRRPRTSDPWGVGLVVGGSVLLGSGGALLGTAYGMRNRANLGISLDDFRNDERQAQALQGAGLSILTIGSAALVYGVVRLVQHRRGGSR